jgi:hypothetical protein
MRKKELDEGLRRGYFRSLTKCLSRLSHSENDGYIKQLAGIMNVYLIGDRHGKEINGPQVGIYSGLPDDDTTYRLKREIDLARGSRFLSQDDFITSFFKRNLAQRPDETDSSLNKGNDDIKQSSDVLAATQLYKSGLGRIASFVNGFKANDINFDCSGKSISLFFMGMNDYSSSRNGVWVKYDIDFERAIENKVDQALQELGKSRFLSNDVFFKHIRHYLSESPSHFQEGIIGPFAYSGIDTGSAFSGLCNTSQSQDSFVLEYTRTSFDKKSPHTNGDYSTTLEKTLFCSSDLALSVKQFSKDDKIIVIGGNNE